MELVGQGSIVKTALSLQIIELFPRVTNTFVDNNE